jgi:hypothetical protein
MSISRSVILRWFHNGAIYLCNKLIEKVIYKPRIFRDVKIKKNAFSTLALQFYLPSQISCWITKIKKIDIRFALLYNLYRKKHEPTDCGSQYVYSSNLNHVSFCLQNMFFSKLVSCNFSLYTVRRIKQ